MWYHLFLEPAWATWILKKSYFPIERFKSPKSLSRTVAFHPSGSLKVSIGGSSDGSSTGRCISDCWSCRTFISFWRAIFCKFLSPIFRLVATVSKILLAVPQGTRADTTTSWQKSQKLAQPGQGTKIRILRHHSRGFCFQSCKNWAPFFGKPTD